jgi:hypothetical protein
VEDSLYARHDRGLTNYVLATCSFLADPSEQNASRRYPTRPQWKLFISITPRAAM